MEICGVACAGWALVGLGALLGVTAFLPARWLPGRRQGAS